MPGFQLPRCSVLEIVSETQKKDPMQQLLNYTTTRLELGGVKTVYIMYHCSNTCVADTA